MDNPNQNNDFRYTYSAKEQTEIKQIREKYAPQDPAEDKMTRLRRLDARVTGKARTVALILGVIGSLILGMGMSLCMTDMGKLLGAYQNWSMMIGVAIGLLGGILISLAYPVYNAIIKRERAKIAPEILRLTDELLK